MALISRDFDTMVDDVLSKIVDADIGITNTSSTSVIRGIVEPIMAENSIIYYNINELYDAYNINTATGQDLDDLVAVLGVIRKDATKCTAMVTFSRPEASLADVAIPYGTVVSTQQNTNGDIFEFIVVGDEVVLPAGDLEVTTLVECTVGGKIYLPQNTITVMNVAPIGIDAVTNKTPISGGSDKENDDDFRSRSKNALTELGKGTIGAIRTAVKNIDGVSDVLVNDMPDGIIATFDVVIASDIIPVTPDKMQEVEDVVNTVKAAGTKPNIIYPEIVLVDVTINISTTNLGEFDPSALDPDDLEDAIVKYVNDRTIGETFIINQMERAVLNFIDNEYADVSTVSPESNVTVTGVQIIKCGVVTITGVGV